MEDKNIWSNLKFTDSSPNLLWELKRQAEQLGETTGGILNAEVKPIDAYDELTGNLGIIYNFYVEAPYLGNYRVLLFTVAEVDKRLIFIDRTVSNEKYETTSIIDLINKIEKYITQAEVANKLSNLYSSSLEIKETRHRNILPGEEWARRIERDFFITYFPQSVRVDLKDGTRYEGSFQSFEDSDELKKELKFRFVRWNDLGKLREEYQRTLKNNPEHSVIIDCREIRHIEIHIPPEFLNALNTRS